MAKKIIENIVRVMNTDLDGDMPIIMALTRIKGVGYNLSRAIIHASKTIREKKLKELSEEEIRKIESVIRNPLDSDIPVWMLNKRKNMETGKDIHITGTDITVTARDELNRLKKIRSYRGIRHELGLPVRGQRTKSSFRKGKSLGVSKKRGKK